MLSVSEVDIAVIGLGYVGLPLAVHMARAYSVVGFDIAPNRVAELRGGFDRTREVGREELAAAGRLALSDSPDDLRAANFFIVTVPTPVNQALQPDLSAVESACVTVGRAMRPGSIVVFESTVYPGATEEVCVPILARESGLAFNHDFFVGYSPERMNPGDRAHRLDMVVKITSGSTPDAADLVDAVYRRIVTAGTRKASSIRVAEAAKVIENIQRDVNIALVNELAQLFDRLDIDTGEVLAAAGTKWNFHPYRPGLVGGHCIGVDPYYLTYKAQSVGFHPEMILAGRRINDGMAAWVATSVVKQMLARKVDVARARILVLGVTFKENCPDIRNSKVVDLIRELREMAGSVDVHDPLADADDVAETYGIALERDMPPGPYDAIVLAVGHDAFRDVGAALLRSLLAPNGLIYDLKQVLPRDATEKRL